MRTAAPAATLEGGAPRNVCTASTKQVIEPSSSAKPKLLSIFQHLIALRQPRRNAHGAAGRCNREAKPEWQCQDLCTPQGAGTWACILSSASTLSQAVLRHEDTTGCQSGFLLGSRACDICHGAHERGNANYRD